MCQNQSRQSRYIKQNYTQLRTEMRCAISSIKNIGILPIKNNTVILNLFSVISSQKYFYRLYGGSCQACYFTPRKPISKTQKLIILRTQKLNYSSLPNHQAVLELTCSHCRFCPSLSSFILT